MIGRAHDELPMNIKQTKEFPPDELAATSVLLGRELERRVHAGSLCGNTSKYGFVSRTLGRLSELYPFYPRDDISFAALEGIIVTDLRLELRGSERLFFETYHDERNYKHDLLVTFQSGFLKLVEQRKPPDASIDISQLIIGDRVMERLGGVNALVSPCMSD